MNSQIAYIFHTQEFELSDGEEEVSSEYTPIDLNDEEYWDNYYTPVNTAPTWIPISPELLNLVKNNSR